MTHSEFGEFLSQQRQLRGLSREDVAQATKISPALVTALEEGMTERLPERIFVLNYLRSYAQVIGASPDDVVNRWHEIPGVAKEPEVPVQQLEAARRKQAVRILIAVLVAAALGTYVFLAATGQAPAFWR